MKQLIKIYILPLALLAAIYCQSCVDDTGNYNYHAIDQAEIKQIKDTLNISLGDTLRVTPTISFETGKDPFTYEWHLIDMYISGGANPYPTGLIARGQNLKILVGGDFFKIPQLYRFLYKAINTRTQVTTTMQFYVKVQSRISLGYVAVCEKPSGFDIDMLSLYKDTLTFYPEVLKILDSDLPKAGRKPLGIVTYADNLSPEFPFPPPPDNPKAVSPKYATFVLSDKGTDRVHPLDFSYKPTYNIKNIAFASMESFPMGEVIAEKMVNSINNRSYMYANNNWYFSESSDARMYVYFGQQINRIKGTPNYFKSAPYIYSAQSGAGAAVIYDTDNKRFVQHKLPAPGSTDYYYSSIVMSTQLIIDDANDPVDFKWNDPDQELIYMSQYKPTATTSKGYAIVKSKQTNEYSILEFSFVSQIITKISKGVFPAGSGIENAKFFLRFPDSNHLYYASDDKISCMFLTTMTQHEIGNNAVPAGHKITLIDCLKAKTKRSLVAVATYDPSGQIGTNGTLKFFDVDPANGKLSLAKHPAEPTADNYQIDMSWSGFGKIAGLDYKAK